MVKYNSGEKVYFKNYKLRKATLENERYQTGPHLFNHLSYLFNTSNFPIVSSCYFRTNFCYQNLLNKTVSLNIYIYIYFLLIFISANIDHNLSLTM